MHVCEIVFTALRYYANHDYLEWENTANVLSFVTDLVKILNIRSKMLTVQHMMFWSYFSIPLLMNVYVDLRVVHIFSFIICYK